MLDIDNTHILINLLENEKDNIVLGRTMSLIFSLGFLKSIINNKTHTDIELSCIRLCSDTVLPVLRRMESMGMKFNWRTMKHSCVVYVDSKGWYDIISGKEVPNGDINL